MPEYMYRVDYRAKIGWQPYFVSDSTEAAKEYLAVFESKSRKWFTMRGVEMSRTRNTDGTYDTLRIVRNSVVTMQEVEEIKTRKAAREAKAS